MKISVIYNHKDKKYNLFIIMQCKLSKNKGEDFMLKSIRKFFSMILPICMLVTTAPCIISTAEGKTVNFYIMGSIRAEVEGKQVNFFYDDEPSITSLQSGEGNNSPIATLSSDNNNVTFSEDEAGDAAFTATSSDGANFTLKLKVTDDAKKRGWMGTMDPFVRGDWSENPIYGSEKSCDVTKGNENNIFGIALTKGKYIEIEKPSGDFDEKKFSKAISVTDYEGNTFFFGKGSNYTQAVQGEDGAGDGPGGGIKVTVEDEAPFTCVEKICEGTGIDIKVTDSAKSYTLSGTGTCKLRFKDNRKGVWLAGNDGSECGYVEVSTYANDEDKANDKIIGTREIVKAGGYYYSDAGKSEIVHVKFVPNDGYMTTIKKVKENDGATAEDVFVKLSGDEKNDNEKHYLTYNSIYAKKIENFGEYFEKTGSTTKVDEAVKTEISDIKAEYTDTNQSYTMTASKPTKAEEASMDVFIEEICTDKSTDKLTCIDLTVTQQYDRDSDTKKVTDFAKTVKMKIKFNGEAGKKVKNLKENQYMLVARDHNGKKGIFSTVYVKGVKKGTLSAGYTTAGQGTLSAGLTTVGQGTVDTENQEVELESDQLSTYGFYIVTDNAIANNVVSANNLKTGEDASYLTFLGVLLVTGGWLFILSKRKNKILK